jgi:hypothetical protein
MVVQSRAKSEPWVTFTFIKKTADAPGAPWEKLAAGRTVKMSLPELAAILAVCRGDRPVWKTYHKFNGDGTAIEVRHERDRSSSENDAETVVFAVGGYTRPVTWPELEVLKDLLKHLFQEKIACATGNNEIGTKAAEGEAGLVGNEVSETLSSPTEPPIFVAPPISARDGPEVSNEGGPCTWAASVQRVTPKAICVANDAGATMWIPKSALADGVLAPDAPVDGAWSFAVKDWFAHKDEFHAWAGGA